MQAVGDRHSGTIGTPLPDLQPASHFRIPLPLSLLASSVRHRMWLSVVLTIHVPWLPPQRTQSLPLVPVCKSRENWLAWLICRSYLWACLLWPGPRAKLHRHGHQGRTIADCGDAPSGDGGLVSWVAASVHIHLKRGEAGSLQHC